MAVSYYIRGLITVFCVYLIVLLVLTSRRDTKSDNIPSHPRRLSDSERILIVSYEDVAKSPQDSNQPHVRRPADRVNEPVHSLARDHHVTMEDAWSLADSMIDQHQLFPDNDTAIELVLRALERARIMRVTSLAVQGYERGTANKWILELDGGQRAVMKIVW